MKRKKLLIFLLCALAVFALCAYGVYSLFFDIQRIKGQEKIQELTSPDGQYTLLAYLNNDGATTNYAVLCSVKNNQTGKTKNIYWNYPCWNAEVTWLDGHTVTINGIVLNVRSDTFDYRNP
jgi:hypothetical protein